MALRDFHVMHGTNAYTVYMALHKTNNKLLAPRLLVEEHQIPLCSGERIGGSNLDWLSAFELDSYSGRANHERLVEATRYALSAAASRVEPASFDKDDLALRIDLDYHATNYYKKEQLKTMRLTNLDRLREVLNDSSNQSHRALVQYGAIPTVCIGTTLFDVEGLKGNAGSSVSGEVLIRELLIRHIITTTHQNKLALDELLEVSQSPITTSVVDCEFTCRVQGFGEKLGLKHNSPMHILIDGVSIPFDSSKKKIVILPIAEIREIFAKSRRTTNQKHS
jgi:hypothetical protein